VDPVDPAVDVVGPGQRPLVERRRLVLPVLGQPRDRRRRQAVAGAQELRQRRTEIRAGQAVQVQQRQHLGHPRRLACPRGQDRRSEPFPLPSGRIGALVVDPRRPHRHRARRRDHLAFVVMTVADHQPVTILIDLLGMGVDVGRHLRLQGDREHLPRSLAHDLIEHRTARLVGLGLVVDYLEHGRTFPTGAPTPAHDQTCYGLSIFLGKVRPFTSLRREPSTGSDHCSPLSGTPPQTARKKDRLWGVHSTR